MKASELIKEIERQPGFKDDPEVFDSYGSGVNSIHEVGSDKISGGIVLLTGHVCQQPAEPQESVSVEVGMPDTLEKAAVRALRDLAADLESGKAQVSVFTFDPGVGTVAVEGEESRSMFTGKGSISVEWSNFEQVTAFLHASNLPKAVEKPEPEPAAEAKK